MLSLPKLTLARYSAGLLAFALVAALCVPMFGRTAARGNITKGISNCRQIITALRLYAGDHNGQYPTGESANQVFRQLFAEQIIDTEQIFGCPLSPYEPDNNIGSPPDFAEAVKPGENHWAMTKSLTDESARLIPLVYESPINAEWPPKWIPRESRKSIKGSSWSNARIIVGLNDSSVSLQNLAAKSGPPVSLAPVEGEKLNLFEKAIDPLHFPVGKVLDVE